MLVIIATITRSKLFKGRLYLMFQAFISNEKLRTFLSFTNHLFFTVKWTLSLETLSDKTWQQFWSINFGISHFLLAKCQLIEVNLLLDSLFNFSFLSVVLFVGYFDITKVIVNNFIQINLIELWLFDNLSTIY